MLTAAALSLPTPTSGNLGIEEGQRLKITENPFGNDFDFVDEYSLMAAHEEEMQGLSEIDGEDL